MSKTAMKLALEALENAQANFGEWWPEAITALREALADQPAQQQEPVAVVSGYYGGQCVVLPTNPARIFNSGTAFYTSPPASKPWVGLTDEEIRKINQEVWGYVSADHTRMWDYARAIEAKLQEKNHG